VVGSKYWSPAPLPSVGAVTLTVGTSGVTVNVAVFWLGAGVVGGDGLGAGGGGRGVQL
jgi:hypothetical protein